MTQADERILEMLSSTGIVLSPAVLVYNLDYERGTISRRISKLAKAGLVTKLEDGYYEISEQGEAYLAGDFDASELKEPE